VRQADPYSRRIYILKVALPLIALLILSTLFLTSGRLHTGGEIPFAAEEIAERIRDERVTEPFFSGVTSQGHRVTLSAEQLVSNGDEGNVTQEIALRINLADETELALVADKGEVDILNDVARLSGNVLIDSSIGYRIYAQNIEARLLNLDITAPLGIQALGPMGHITAGHLRVRHMNSKEGVQILFSGGVQVLYTPKETGQ
jgi:lipopolysaccharide export system protein LptC